MTTLIRNEFRKLLTVRSTWLLVAVTQLILVGGISGAMASGENDPHDPATAPKLLAHIGLVSVFTLVLGIMAVAGEYRHKTITDTYLATPRREQVVVAKLAAYTGSAAVFAVLNAVLAVLASAAWLSAKGGSLDLTGADVPRTLLGGVLWNVAFAAVGVGIGALVRNLAGAIAAALAWIALVEGIVGQFLGDAGRWLPFRSGMALGRITGADRVLPQWGGGVVLAGYAALFAVLAIATTVRRDVT